VALQGNAGTTWYLNGEDGQSLTYEKEIKANGITEHKHYLAAGGIVFAMQVTRSGTLAAANPAVPGSGQASSLRYFHHDQLGSIAVITDEAGAVLERLAYDPWGKRRYANGSADITDAITALTTDRGFTEHEHLDEMGVIHMNGRIYDPLIGRFMSADPFIQAPGHLQSYNRYSYVLNNPLNLTDPSGFSWWTRFRDKVVKPVVVIVVAYYTGGMIAGSMGYTGATYGAAMSAATTGAAATWGSAIAVGAASGFAAGFTAAALNGGNLEQSLKAGIAGGIVGGAMGAASYASSGFDVLGRVASKGAASGGIAKAQGGNFADALKRTLLTTTAAEVYTKFVGFEADPAAGENSAPYDQDVGGEQSQNTYRPDPLNGKIEESDRYRNAFGLNASLNGDDFMKQGGGLSQAMNMIPGMNALAQFHDTIFNTNLWGMSFNTFTNWATMLPSAVTTYGAIIDRLPATNRSRCPACYR
jgi:RHS repeat-associated protein